MSDHLIRRVTAVRLVAAAAAVGLPVASVSAAPAPHAPDAVSLEMRIDEQTFGVAAGTTLTATFTLTGTAAELEQLAAAAAPTTTTSTTIASPSTTTPTTTAAPTTTAPTTAVPAASSPTSVATSAPAAQSATASPSGLVLVTAHSPIRTHEQLDRVDDHGPGDALDAVAVNLDEALGPDPVDAASSTAAVSVAIATELGDALADDAVLTVGEPGIYPVTIDVRVGDTVVSSTTTFVEIYDPEVDSGVDPTSVAIVARVADPGPWPSPDDMTNAESSLAEAVELATAVDGPLTFQLPPSLLEPGTVSVGPDGESALPSGSTVPDTTAPSGSAPTDPRAVLDGAFDNDELLAQPAIPLDPSSIVAIDKAALFTSQLVAGESAAAAAVPVASRSRKAWVADRPLSAAGAAMLRNLGVQLVIVPADVAEQWGVGDATSVFELDLAPSQPLPGLVVSPLGAGLAAPDPNTTASEAAVRLMVETQLTRIAAPTPALALATPTMAVPDPAVTASYVRFANEVPDLSVRPLSELTGPVGRALSAGSPSSVQPAAAANSDLSARSIAIEAAREDAVHAESMLVDTTPARTWDAGFDQLLASSVDDAEATAHLGAITTEIDGILGAIVPPAPLTLTLTGTSSELRLTVTNTADQPLQVIVRVQSPKLTSPEQPPIEIPANLEQIVSVPVTVRSNGTFTIEVDILTPDHERVAGPVAMKASVTRVTGLSQLATGGAVLALASWWYSHFRRNRRDRIAAANAAAADAADGALTPLSPDAAEALDDGETKPPRP